MKNETAPRQESRSENNTYTRSQYSNRVEEAKVGLGSMTDLLGRHGYRVRGRSVRCPSSGHEDRHPSASLYVARDGDERVRCHSCDFDEDILGVAEALGEHVELSRPRSFRPRRRSSVPTITDRRELKLLRGLAKRAEWPFEWEVAKLLASLPRLLAQQDVVRNWDYLSQRCDIPLVVATADLLRRIEHERRRRGMVA